ncbi:MAG: helix-turn-helix transcriptional regulator, partial [Candidatus Omnitrophica bacterium]|nr:helix-turn-helix transcriptional regulator [Candidatus Omnitrophota bacterium]
MTFPGEGIDPEQFDMGTPEEYWIGIIEDSKGFRDPKALDRHIAMQASLWNLAATSAGGKEVFDLAGFGKAENLFAFIRRHKEIKAALDRLIEEYNRPVDLSGYLTAKEVPKGHAGPACAAEPLYPSSGDAGESKEPAILKISATSLEGLIKQIVTQDPALEHFPKRMTTFLEANYPDILKDIPPKERMGQVWGALKKMRRPDEITPVVLEARKHLVLAEKAHEAKLHDVAEREYSEAIKIARGEPSASSREIVVETIDDAEIGLRLCRDDRDHDMAEFLASSNMGEFSLRLSQLLDRRIQSVKLLWLKDLNRPPQAEDIKQLSVDLMTYCKGLVLQFIQKKTISERAQFGPVITEILTASLSVIKEFVSDFAAELWATGRMGKIEYGRLSNRAKQAKKSPVEDLGYETKPLPEELLKRLPRLTIGGRIVAIREYRGLTQVQLRKLCGIPSGTISFIENSDSVPLPRNLFDISKHLNVDPALILKGRSWAAISPDLKDGERLTLLRLRRGWTQGQLARELEKAGLKFKTSNNNSKKTAVVRWEGGTRPTRNNRMIIRKVLGDQQLFRQSADQGVSSKPDSVPKGHAGPACAAEPLYPSSGGAGVQIDPGSKNNVTGGPWLSQSDIRPSAKDDYAFKLEERKTFIREIQAAILRYALSLNEQLPSEFSFDLFRRNLLNFVNRTSMNDADLKEAINGLTRDSGISRLIEIRLKPPNRLSSGAGGYTVSLIPSGSFSGKGINVLVDRFSSGKTVSVKKSHHWVKPDKDSLDLRRGKLLKLINRFGLRAQEKTVERMEKLGYKYSLDTMRNDISALRKEGKLAQSTRSINVAADENARHPRIGPRKGRGEHYLTDGLGVPGRQERVTKSEIEALRAGAKQALKGITKNESAVDISQRAEIWGKVEKYITAVDRYFEQIGIKIEEALKDGPDRSAAG